MIGLREVDHDSIGDMRVLYALLGERTPEQAISHKAMPSFKEHLRFVSSRPYKAWYFIEHDNTVVGSIYLTNANEIGIFIFQEFHGNSYAPMAIMNLTDMYPGPFYANVNPANVASINLFAKLGFKPLQNTYILEVKGAE